MSSGVVRVILNYLIHTMFNILNNDVNKHTILFIVGSVNICDGVSLQTGVNNQIYIFVVQKG